VNLLKVVWQQSTSFPLCDAKIKGFASPGKRLKSGRFHDA
jgi:hypothetical protein